MSEPSEDRHETARRMVRAAGRAAKRQGREDLLARLDATRRRLDHPEVTTVVVGEFKQGKSTLVNALMNATICPVADDAPTSVPTIVRHAEQPRAAIFADTPDGEGGVVEHRVELVDLVEPALSGRVGATGRRAHTIEVGLPRQLLAAGLRLVDTPGVGGLDSAHGEAALGLLSLAQAVLFVTDASAEFSASEIHFLARAAARCPATYCVLTKIDFYPRWRDVLDRNRDHAKRAGLAVPMIPVSSSVRQRSIETDDAELHGESGYAELVGRIRNEVLDAADARQVHVAAADVAFVANQLLQSQRAERAALADPETLQALIGAAEAAKARHEELRSASSRWNTVLNDGMSDLSSDSEHDLRTRSRKLLAEVEGMIDDDDPADIGAELSPLVERRMIADVAETYQLMNEAARALAERVDSVFGAEAGPAARTGLEVPDAVLADLGALELAVDERPGMGQAVLTGLRGSYGGMAMFGMLGSVVGLATVGPAGLVAGALLGRKGAGEERNRQLTARRQQAKAGVRKYIEGVVFEVSKHRRDALRVLQRDLRDANIARVDELRITVEETLESARRAVDADRRRAKERLAALEKEIAVTSRLRSAAEQLISS